MQAGIREYRESDNAQAIAIWNSVVEEGIAFPQEELLTPETGAAFFAEQSFTGVACHAESGEMLGLYILHPNNIGRCGHICNASYAVRRDMRGKHIGEALVRHCMAQGKAMGFGILQFNAVVSTNAAALRLYARLGFTQMGVIPGGFRMKNGNFADISPHYRVL